MYSSLNNHLSLLLLFTMGGGEVESAEKEWEKFSDIVMECTNAVCGMRRVGGQRRVNVGQKKRNGEVAEKRRAFEEWLYTEKR